MMGFDTWPEFVELGLSGLVALLAVYTMQRLLGRGAVLTPRQIRVGRIALAVLAIGAALSGVRPAFEFPSPQILLLTPLLILLGWVATLPIGALTCDAPGSTSSSPASHGSPSGSGFLRRWLRRRDHQV